MKQAWSSMEVILRQYSRVLHPLQFELSSSIEIFSSTSKSNETNIRIKPHHTIPKRIFSITASLQWCWWSAETKLTEMARGTQLSDVECKLAKKSKLTEMICLIERRVSFDNRDQATCPQGHVPVRVHVRARPFSSSRANSIHC
jgi:hypothetical protein